MSLPSIKMPIKHPYTITRLKLGKISDSLSSMSTPLLFYQIFLPPSQVCTYSVRSGSCHSLFLAHYSSSSLSLFTKKTGHRRVHSLGRTGRVGERGRERVWIRKGGVTDGLIFITPATEGAYRDRVIYL